MNSNHNPLNNSLFSKYDANDSLFDVIYKAAKAGDSQTLTWLMNHGVIFSRVFRDRYNPLTLLVKNNEKEAVFLLIKQYYGSISSAVCAAAYMGNIELTIELITSYNDYYQALVSAEEGEQHQLVEQLKKLKLKATSSNNSNANFPPTDLTNCFTEEEYVDQNVNTTRALYEIIENAKNLIPRKLQLELVNCILSPTTKLSILAPAVKNHDFVVINILLVQLKTVTSDLILKNVIEILAKALNGNEENMLQFIAEIDHEQIRRGLTVQARLLNKHINLKSFREKADRINHLLRVDGLSYEEARVWKLNLHIWFLQGIQLIAREKLPLEIFIEISAYVMERPRKVAIKVFDKHQSIMPDKLKKASFAEAQSRFEKNQSKWYPQFYVAKLKKLDPQTMLDNEKANAETRCQSRIVKKTN